MKTSILRASAAVAAASLLAVAAASTSGASAAGSTSFTDPAGDVQGAAADITSVVVGDDPASGIVTLTVTAAGYGAVPDGTRMMFVYLNTDMNPLTGAPNQDGTEVVLAALNDAEGSGWGVFRWDGSDYVLAPQSATLGFSRSGDTMTWTFNKADVGVSTGFVFSVWSALFDASDNLVGKDDAPDDGGWLYVLSTTPPPPAPAPAPAVPAAQVKPVIGAPSATPAKPVAGKRMTVVFPVTRSDTGAPLAKGTLICDPSVGGKVVSHTERFAAGKARLSFVVPASAKGRQLKVKVTIKVGGQAATRIAAYRIG